MVVRWLFLLLIVATFPVGAQTPASIEGRIEINREADIEVPPLPRRKIVVPRIDQEHFELGAWSGSASVENFSADVAQGFRASLFVTEDFFLEAGVAQSTVRDTTFRDIGLPLFTQESERLVWQYYGMGYNLLPGELFFGKRRVFTSSLYIFGGLGDVRFADDEWFAITYGGGVRLLPADWLSLRVDLRLYEYQSDLLGTNAWSHVFEAALGLSVFF